VLAAQPELVRQDLIASSEVFDWRPSEHGGAVRRGDDVYYPVVGREVPRSELRLGSVGDPKAASIDTGQQLLDAQAEHICNVIVRDLGYAPRVRTNARTADWARDPSQSAMPSTNTGSGTPGSSL
jgi:hypothetical protein